MLLLKFQAQVHERLISTNPGLKANVEILLSAHARTSQADILHLDQKAAKCTTCKLVCGKF